MKYLIIHETDYTFSSQVFLEPHYLRFKPRTTPFSKPDYFDLKICPGPAGMAESSDAENNLIHMVWFNGLIDFLSIRAESKIAVEEHNPFNFMLYPGEFLQVPFKYSAATQLLLTAYLEFSELSTPALTFRDDVLASTKGNTIDFLTELTRQIHQNFQLIERLVGEPFEANHTFESKVGSCRDLTWMEIQLLRNMGIAARFVSGYYFIPVEDPKFELHGWLEVFLPGAGWIGFDPSHGIAAGSSHITIATSSNYENTMPVTGSIRGDATSTLTHNLSITRVN